MRFSFGEYVLDSDRFELRRAGDVVSIQPKVLELILHLVRHRDRTVTPEQLFRAVWREAAVTRSSLDRVVSLARRSIGDDGRMPSKLVTVKRRGYRFAAPVKIDAEDSTEGSLSDHYVGRATMLARAEASLARGLAGSGRILYLAGEAGIGKTRTAQRLAEAARAGRAEVVAVWSIARGSPTYWSWTCLLRQLIESDPRILESISAAHRAWIVRLIAHDPAAQDSVSIEALPSSSSARIALFDAVVECLTRIAKRRSLALVIDDLQALDTESLSLIEFFGRSIASLPVVIIATSREEDVDLAPRQGQALERLLRLADLERWPITGLQDDEIAHFVRIRIGRDPDSALRSALERQTGGNPLLLGESLRSLDARGLLGGTRTRSEWEGLLPRGIEHLVRPKLRPLSPAAIALLGVTAAIGVEAELEWVADCVDDPASMDATLEEVVAQGLIVSPVPNRRVRFAHALVRDAIYELLLPAGPARGKRHARIHQALQARLQAGDLEPTRLTAEIARHACLAAPLVEPVEAAGLARAAAEQAARLFDFEGAAQWFARGLEVLALARDPNAELSTNLLVGLALASARSVSLEAARGDFLRAAASARAAGMPESLAQAALGLAGRPHSTGEEDPDVVALLDEALASLPSDAVALRIRVASRLAAEIRYSDADRTRSLADEALAAARVLGDPGVLAETLEDGTFLRWSPSDPAGWIALNEEVAREARRAGDLDLAISGHKGCVSGCLEIGDISGVARATRACERTAKEAPTPYARWWVAVLDASRALLEGELAAAEGAIAESLGLAERIDSPEIAIELKAELVYLRIEQLRCGEIEAAAREHVRRFPHQPTWRAGIARIFILDGRFAEARDVLAPILAAGFETIPLDRGWMATHALLAEVVAAIGDESAARALELRLAPFAPRSIVIGSAVYYGPIERYLGLLVAAQHRHAEAVEWLEAAMDSAQHVGARIFVARIRVDLAKALHGRDEKGDRSRARRLLQEAIDGAERHGFHAVRREAWAVERLFSSARSRTSATPRTEGTNAKIRKR